MKTHRLHTAALLLSLLATQTRADEKPECKCTTEQCKMKARAALAWAQAARKPGFVNLAPMPRSIPAPMPAAKCDCGESCRCAPGQCPVACPKPAAKKETSTPPPQMVIVGYQSQCYLGPDGRRYCVQVPVYGYR